tara:strand:- start:1070 stop:1939 length:870 start_codon:yes stop_codon:yes gene_type:complete
MFVKGHCSPRKDKIKDSCLKKKTLLSIAKILNKKNNAKIKLKKISKKKLYSEIKKHLSKSECKTEACWGSLTMIIESLSEKEKKELNTSFRPKQPKKWKENPNTWLNTTDINSVMKQYEIKYPHFKYFEATPIDFHLKSDANECLVSSLCNINIPKLKKKKKSIGLVFNTDKHNQPGQHWFSMYIDLVGKNRKNPSIYYFDSAEAIHDINDLPLQILDLIERVQKQVNYKFDVLYNDKQHQYGDTECGIYCLHFLIKMLEGIQFRDYVHSQLNDKQMEKFRKEFFIQIE